VGDGSKAAEWTKNAVPATKRAIGIRPFGLQGVQELFCADELLPERQAGQGVYLQNISEVGEGSLHVPSGKWWVYWPQG